MCFYIGIEDLAANALIEALEKGDKRFLTYQEIENYGTEVARFLSESGEKVVLLLSRETTTALFRNYSDFFVEWEENQVRGIALKDSKGVDELIEQFRGYLALDILKAFVNKRTIQALGV